MKEDHRIRNELNKKIAPTFRPLIPKIRSEMNCGRNIRFSPTITIEQRIHKFASLLKIGVMFLLVENKIATKDMDENSEIKKSFVTDTGSRLFHGVTPMVTKTTPE